MGRERHQMVASCSFTWLRVRSKSGPIVAMSEILVVRYDVCKTLEMKIVTMDNLSLPSDVSFKS